MAWTWTDPIDSTTDITSAAFFRVFIDQANLANRTGQPGVGDFWTPPAVPYDFGNINNTTGHLLGGGWLASPGAGYDPCALVSMQSVVRGSAYGFHSYNYPHPAPARPAAGFYFTRVRYREIYKYDPVRMGVFNPPGTPYYAVADISPDGWVQGYITAEFYRRQNAPWPLYCPNAFYGAVDQVKIGQRALRRSMPPWPGSSFPDERHLDGQVYVWDGVEWSRDPNPLARADILCSLRKPPYGTNCFWSPAFGGASPADYFPASVRTGDGGPREPVALISSPYTGPFIEWSIDGDIIGPWLFEDLRDVINLGYIDNTRRGPGTDYLLVPS